MIESKTITRLAAPFIEQGATYLWFSIADNRLAVSDVQFTQIKGKASKPFNLGVPKEVVENDPARIAVALNAFAPQE